ncbi:hydrogenase maturation nickel metallochaperone HypA [Geomonas sp. RF6]|uniref:hydrogenase maturation nickel metallochaperone HypA n=1 Tax=Geomonas sp. RF6 TaxID=2897342 RepID=UPI001E3B862A|nr:hydrogenase maturation nickel metallochaperone HypA [Geomonas sp. RF6]UFS70411.1 hydrogenase maturation nickel metallochaperone HypA [Geomonas sp. RF6]
MHELSVTEGLLKIITDEVQGTSVRKVYGVNLVIGDLASIVDESVQFYFDILSKGSIAEAARLSITRVPAEFSCRSCGFNVQHRQNCYKCLACGGNDVLVTKGYEFYIDSIEVETSEDCVNAIPSMSH